jgi:hypothetical protein
VICRVLVSSGKAVYGVRNRTRRIVKTMINLPIKSRIKSHEARPEKKKVPAPLTMHPFRTGRSCCITRADSPVSTNFYCGPRNQERKKKTGIAVHSISIIMPNPFPLAGQFSDSKTRRGETSEESRCAPSRIQSQPRLARILANFRLDWV